MESLGGETVMKKPMWLYPQLMGTNPSERWGHSSCYFDGALYVFGGCCGGLHFSDVLMLNLDLMFWSTVATVGQGPGPRDSHSSVLVGHRMIVFGGTNGCKKVNDLHILDLNTNEWTTPVCRGTPPSPRESHTATLVGDDKVVVFGGNGEGEANHLNDLHVLDLNTMRWSSPLVNGDVPVPRDSHGAVVIGNKFFVYGGDRGDRYHGGVDVLDLETMTWTKLVVQGPSPGGRAGHATVNIGAKVCVIGGVGDKCHYNDVWVLDASTCCWSQLEICGKKPQGRFSHTAVVANSDIVIYGGCGEDERPLNEMLVLQLGAEHPNGRYNISMCKIFGNHANQANRRFLRGAENSSGALQLINGEIMRKRVHEPELESKRPFQFASDNLHPKRERASSYKAWEVEPEQEEHSLSLSQHSSPSQSDQEQTPVRKVSDSLAASRGLNLFNQFPRNCQPYNTTTNQKDTRNMVQRSPYDLQTLREHKKPEDGHRGIQGTPFAAVARKPADAFFIQNMIGSEVHGKVDGAFDSGLLMTAAVNGKIYRGVLFSPAAELVSRGTIVAQSHSSSSTQIGIVQPLPNSNHIDPFKLTRQPALSSLPESNRGFRQVRTARGYPVMRPAQSALAVKESKRRNDLQGLVLTLGGPGSSHI